LPFFGTKDKNTNINDPKMQTNPTVAKSRFVEFKFFNIKYNERIIVGRLTNVIDRISPDLFFIVFI
jgi:hypothetical protein